MKNLKIISVENNILLKHLYNGGLEFDIYNIDDLFMDNKNELSTIIKNDIEQKEMIYYSYVLKNFPYFSLELFED